MSDDETRPIDPEGPPPPPTQEVHPPAQPPAYAMPLPAGYPAYAVPQPAHERPRFTDQVLGMRAVVAVALACLIIGGLSGWILGHAAGSDGGRFGGPGGFLQQRSAFPNGQDGFPSGPNGAPGQRFGPGQFGPGRSGR